MLQVNDIIQASVEKIVLHGKGLIRYQGWVIFVDDVIQGETVRLKITQKKKSYFLGQLLEVMQPSPHRVEPLCPYFGVCGGCQLQHLAYPEQVQVKKEWVQEAIQKQVVAHSAEKEWAYRQKVTLHFEVKDEKVALGYYAKDNQTLLDINCCPIFTHVGDPIFKELHVQLLESKITKGDVTLLKNDGAYLVKIAGDGREVVLGSPQAKVSYAGLTFFISLDVFLQNYPEMSFKLYQDVIHMVPKGEAVLDLYCGVGMLSLLLAKAGHKVFGIECNEEAIRLAKMSATTNELANATFTAGLVEKVLGKNKAIKDFNFWIVNPPREGLSDEMRAHILHYLPKELVYISCSPSTLARDLKVLCKEGYTTEVGVAFDMFPQTAHVETVVVLKKKR